MSIRRNGASDSNMEAHLPALNEPPDGRASLALLAPGDRRQLQTLGLSALPALIERTGPKGWRAFLNFFGANIENDNTREAYLLAVRQFLEACEQSRVAELSAIEPFIVGAYVRHLREEKGLTKSSVKQKLAALRKFFDFLVVEQVIERSPALSVRGPKLKVRKGKTPILTIEEFKKLIGAIDRSTLIGKRDYAWLVTAFTSWCRVTAIIKLTVADYTHSGKRSYIDVEEKGGEVDRMPLHRKAQEALDELISAAELGDAPTSPIFQSVDRKGNYTGTPLKRQKVWEMVRRRARRAGISHNICCHTFRGTGITEFIRAGGRIERAQRRAHHADSRTTKIYDHSDDGVLLEDVELVQF